MKHFAQAAAEQVRLSSLGHRCSEIPHDQAKNLFHKTIKLRERKSQIIFEAFVVDYCGSDEKGIIVSFEKKTASKLSTKNTHPAESKKFVEMDLRDKFNGNEFDLVG